jgi:hypothetical protein
MMRFQSPPRADSLNHTPVPHVNNLPSELIGGKPGTPLSGDQMSLLALPGCAQLLKEVLLIGGTANVSTVRSHLHRVTTRPLDFHRLDRASFVWFT